MSNLNKFLAAIISGDTTGLPEPDTGVEKALAKALGVYDGPLDPVRGDADVLLHIIAEQGIGGGGAELPELTNPADLNKILEGYEAIDQNGRIVVGEMPDHTGQIVQVQVDLENERVHVPWGFHDGFTGVAIQVESVDVTPSDTQQVIYASDGKVIGKVTVEPAKGDDFKITDASYLFYNRARIDEEHMEFLMSRLGKVTTMENMFYQCKDSPKVIDLSGLDTSECTSLKLTFMQCTGVKELDVSKFNTSKVTDMYMTFKYCTQVEELDLSGWDTSNVTNMSGTFQGMKALKRIDLSNFDTSKAASMATVFQETTSVTCNALEEIIGFSAMNKAGLTNLGFPYGTATAPLPLKRLTFRTDLPEGKYAIRSPINISYDSFTRHGLVEMFNTLTDVSEMTHNANYKKITITGNPGVTGVAILPAKQVQYDTLNSYEDFLAAADEFYGDYDRTGATITVYLIGASPSNQTVNLADYDEAMFEQTYSSIKFNTFNATVPEEDILTDEDRAIATNKGWTLVE